MRSRRPYAQVPRRLGGLRQEAFRWSPTQVLAYLGRYTHRVAIANSRIQDCDDDPCRLCLEGLSRRRAPVKTMCLKPDEFIRRFLLHALPDGFHRILATSDSA